MMFGFAELRDRVERIQSFRYWNALGWFVVLGTLALIFLPTLVTHAHRAADIRVVNDDARAQIPPFFRYQGRQTFVHDYIVDYYLECFFPRGYRGLYGFAGWLGGAESL